jgi:hypothetical protein
MCGCFRNPIEPMKKGLSQILSKRLLLGAAIGWIACGGTEGTPNPVSAIIESQDYIISENGVLELTAGTLSVQSISLIGAEGNVLLLGPVTLDLLVPEQQLALCSEIPAGDYTGLHIELAPTADGAQTLDVDLELVATRESIRATTLLLITGNRDFPEGVRTIADGSALELRVLLRGMFFYLRPVSDAVEGHYAAGESEREFLTMNLVGAFDLRVSP